MIIYFTKVFGGVNVRNIMKRTLIAISALFLCLSAYCVYAEEPKKETPVSASADAGNAYAAQKTVSAVDVSGNKNVSAQTILAKLKTKTGEPYSATVANEDLKRLYSTGLFTDIKIDAAEKEDGLHVTFVVTEKPILKVILFEGNKIYRSDRLIQEIKIKPGEIVDSKQVKDGINEIYKLYEKKGYHLTKIDFKSEQDPATNEATVRIIIDEGIRYKIADIFIEGNNAFKDKRILKLMSTKKDGLFTSGFFKKETLEADLDKIKSFYRSAGYIDVNVVDETRYDEKAKKLFITIYVDEGKKYLVGDIAIKGNSIIKEQLLRDKLKMVSNSTYSEDNLRQDVSSIQGLYYEKGYIFAEVTPETKLSSTAGKIDIAYTIIEGDLCYVDKIRIRGNTKTKDIVIRRELRLLPGDQFDGTKLQRSKERLYNLGFFEEVAYDTEAGSAPNKKDLIVNVKETKTGEFSFGAGYSSVEHAVGFVEVAQNNFDFKNWPTFTGDGQNLKLRAEFGSLRRNYQLSWTEPWIFDYPVSFGFDAYNMSTLRSGSSGFAYDENRTGGALRLGKEITEYLKGGLTYRLEDVNIANVPDTASADFKAEEGANTLSTFLGELTQDTRDSIYNPSRGYIATLSSEIAGGPFGGSKNFVKHIAGGSIYFKQFDKLVLEARMRAGIADGFSNTGKVPIYERFFAGGANTIRGYKERRVGPLDQSGEPIGGESMLLGGLEYTMPILSDNFKGALFYDIGNVWSKVSDFGSGNFKAGAGFGFRIKTPIGPIKIDYGIPLNPDDQESKTGKFYFNVSRGF